MRNRGDIVYSIYLKKRSLFHIIIKRTETFSALRISHTDSPPGLLVRQSLSKGLVNALKDKKGQNRPLSREGCL